MLTEQGAVQYLIITSSLSHRVAQEIVDILYPLIQQSQMDTHYLLGLIEEIVECGVPISTAKALLEKPW